MMNTKLAARSLVLMLAIASFATAQDEKKNSSDKKGEETNGLKVGDKAPDFEVETFDEKTVTLSERFGKDGKPVILLFSRANW
jgi:cytochrome oxidase Cu insertion factor (SCO1/SenC/PrrC family)